MKTVTITKDMLIWHDDRSGLYKSPKGYVLVEYATGDARWMNKRWANDFLKVVTSEANRHQYIRR